MRIIKFGGTSVANAERLAAAARIVADHRAQGPVAVVVSAMAGITDALIAVAQRAAREQTLDQQILDDIVQRHRDAYQTCLGQVPEAFAQQWRLLLTDAAWLLLSGTQEERSVRDAAFSAWGERLLAPLFATVLNHAGVRAAAFQVPPIVLESMAAAQQSPRASLLATRAWLLPQLGQWLWQQITPVLPGYVARDPAGRLTTLGRNGSDYSAALIAATLGADSLYIYSDVAGVYTADPHRDPTAVLLPTLTYAQAARLAEEGVKVLHPRTIGPLAHAAIPLELRSTLAPEQAGTSITGDSLPVMAINQAVPYTAIWSL